MNPIGRFLTRFVPLARRSSIDAALAEAASTPDVEEAEQWRSAARAMLVRGLIVGPVLRSAVLWLVVAAVAVVNESSSDIANQVTLVFIAAGAGLVGFVWVRRAWLAGVLIGCTVAVEHVVRVALGVENPDVHLPPGWWSSTSLLILLVPAVIAAYGGVGLRRLASGRRET
ncbi:hypothetical protein [Amnibacterium sp.]|uniref:hypothetical protein n=1 Tax=Amnibacterium sp. TaxID=1872496 RepID=UPI002629CB6A|nr:hypothetical protein [Amnibacterium sp.]MCU1472907.1 hypothetical protein [Amnibacterium sp.]